MVVPLPNLVVPVVVCGSVAVERVEGGPDAHPGLVGDGAQVLELGDGDHDLRVFRAETMLRPSPSARTTTLRGSSPICQSTSEGAVRELRVAGAQDGVGLHDVVELDLQGGTGVDLSENTATLLG